MGDLKKRFSLGHLVSRHPATCAADLKKIFDEVSALADKASDPVLKQELKNAVKRGKEKLAQFK